MGGGFSFEEDFGSVVFEFLDVFVVLEVGDLRGGKGGREVGVSEWSGREETKKRRERKNLHPPGERERDERSEGKMKGQRRAQAERNRPLDAKGKSYEQDGCKPRPSESQVSNGTVPRGEGS